MFDRWVQDCPWRYSSPNASRSRDVLGTLMPGIPAGAKRCAHIAGVRGDAVAAKAVGLRGMVSEYSVLATNTSYDIAAIGQLHRDGRDCVNGFDELKNSWGWGGFTTQDMHRSQVTARAVALVCDWCSWYVRGANPQARREALTSRPPLLAAIGRATSSGNQTTMYLTPMHAEASLIESMIANVHAATRYVKAAAEQFPKIDRWRTLLANICQCIVGQIGLPTPPSALSAPGKLLFLGWCACTRRLADTPRVSVDPRFE